MVTGRALLGERPAEPLRVLVANLEDPLEEVERRIAAACLHYGIGEEDIGDRLFLVSESNEPIVIAEQSRDGPIITTGSTILEQIIRDNFIDVAIFDPFVSLHRVAENDNMATDMVVKELSRIARSADCAIEIVHHTRKLNNVEASIDAVRGGSAIIGAVRSARVLTRMTAEESEKFGVQEHWRHFRVADGKANFSPPADRSTWFRLASIDLGNHGPDGEPSDLVGVTERWVPPSPLDGLDVSDLARVQERIAGGEFRKSDQSPEWVGCAVADVLGLDAENPADRSRIKSLLNTWTANGVLKTVHRPDKNRQTRPFVVVGERVFASSAAPQHQEVEQW